MRIPRLALAILLLPQAPAALNAQGLEYRMNMVTTVANVPRGVPVPKGDAVVFVQGTSLRMDMKIASVSRSILMDHAAGTLYQIDHNKRTYTDESLKDKADSLLAGRDTAALRAAGVIPDVTYTPDKRTILGYETNRVLSVRRIPYPIAGDSVIVMVMEPGFPRTRG